MLLSKLGGADALAALLRALGEPELAVWPQADAGDNAERLQACAAAEQAACAGLLAAWSTHGEDTLDAVVAHTDSKRLSGRSYRPDWNRGRIAACAAALRGGAAPAALDKLACFGSRKLAAASKADLAGLPNAFTAAVDAWLDAEAALRAAQSQRWLGLLAAARTHAATQLDLRKRRAARQSYDDLIRRLHHAISDPTHGARLADTLHARYPVILVDEFQDTDVHQFGIFRRMHAARGDGALFLSATPSRRSTASAAATSRPISAPSRWPGRRIA